MKIEKKIQKESNINKWLNSLPRPLVMTNGVFDVLHRGHVSYLSQAAELGASLVVAVNTDHSVRMLGKGNDRPLNSEHDRAYVLAGLESIDIVTFFDTKTPVDIIKKIKPDIYVKGGDYDMEQLEETKIVRSWGGHSISIPFVEGYSTTALINRIQSKKRRAAFLDRDGVINKDKSYVGNWKDFEFISGSIEGMRLLQAVGYELVVVTNQSGLARGYYTEAEYLELTKKMLSELGQHGVKLAGVYYCPHHAQGIVPELSVDCNCRKPAPGMLLDAARELNLALEESILIGDKQTDIIAARAAGLAKAYSVKSDNIESKAEHLDSDKHFDDLLTCAKYLVEECNQK